MKIIHSEKHVEALIPIRTLLVAGEGGEQHVVSPGDRHAFAAALYRREAAQSLTRSRLYDVYQLSLLHHFREQEALHPRQVSIRFIAPN